jgi:hypothetical protein
VFASATGTRQPSPIMSAETLAGSFAFKLWRSERLSGIGAAQAFVLVQPR